MSIRGVSGLLLCGPCLSGDLIVDWSSLIVSLRGMSCRSLSAIFPSNTLLKKEEVLYGPILLYDGLLVPSGDCSALE